MKTIYKIENQINHKVYIGQTKNYNKRYKEHKNDLKNNRHANTYLQEDYNKYGLNNFKWEILEEVNDQEGNIKEDFWMDYYGGIDSENIYNSTNSYTKSKFMKNKLSNYYKGKSHIETYGEELAKKMSIQNSLKHKGKRPPVIPNKGKVRDINNNMILVKEELYTKVKYLRSLGKTYKEISIETNIKENGVRSIVVDSIHLYWKCND